MAYFPLFIDLKDQSCVVIGGGMVSFRKVRALLEFDASVTVIAPRIGEEIRELSHIAHSEHLILREKEYEESDIEGAALVIAATNNSLLNKSIATICKAKNIPINVVDVQEECSFIFPAYIKKGAVTVGVTSSGKSPMISQRIKSEVEKVLPDYLEKLVDVLGQSRELVKSAFETEAERKHVYSRLIKLGIDNDGNLEQSDIKEVIETEKRRPQ